MVYYNEVRFKENGAATHNHIVVYNLLCETKDDGTNIQNEERRSPYFDGGEEEQEDSYRYEEGGKGVKTVAW